MSIQRSDLDAARRSADRAVQLDPALGLAYSLRAALASDPTAGRADAERSVKLLPYDPAGWLTLAYLCLRARDLRRAEEACQECLTSSGGQDIEARTVLALVRVHQGRAAEGLAEADRLIAQAPDHLQGHHVRLEALLALGRFDEVIRECEAFLAGGALPPEVRKEFVDYLERARRR